MKVKMRYLQWVGIGCLVYLAIKHQGDSMSVLYVCAAVLVLAIPILINKKV